MRCKIYSAENAPPMYGRGTRVRFKRALSVGTKVFNQTIRCDVDKGSTGTIVSVFPNTVIDLDTDQGGDIFPTMRVSLRPGTRLKDDFDIIDDTPALRVIK
jgi:hypothetical protein